MRATIFRATLAALACCLLFVGCDDGSGSSGNDAMSDMNGSDTTTNQSGFEPCTANNPCPDGQFCFNGLCAIGCTSNGDCADDQYCATDTDMLCHNKQVPTCSADTDCAESQICKDGLCSTPPMVSTCTPSPDGNDGCDEYSICLEGDMQGENACYTFPPCAEDGSCPTGTQGAVCNDGHIQNKAKICLTGLCETVDNCPTDWSCAKANDNDVLGFCSNGGEGAPCGGDGDCQSGLSCMQPAAGSIGFCTGFGFP